MNIKLELISFNVCPFVQRSVITLLEKNVDFKLTYIDLYNQPQWFKDISPLEKVPVLKVGHTVLFESAIINEYLDEVNLPRMLPTDPLLRAQNRAWIEFGSDMIMNHYNLITAKNLQKFMEYKDLLVVQFSQLEAIMSVGTYFNGNELSLVDFAFAPLFMRLNLLEDQYQLELYKTDSHIMKWSRSLAALDSVKNSVTLDFQEVYSRFVISLDSYYSKNIKTINDKTKLSSQVVN